jgi:hypothetical protein
VKVNAMVFWALTAFFAAEVALYTVWNLISRGQVEVVGTVGIGLCAVFCGLIAFFLTLQHRAQGRPLPEDRPDANIEDGDAEIGHFSPWSWWPILLAASAWLVFLGLAVGIWIALIGGALGIVCLVGWAFEYYRGNFAR